MSTDGVNNGNIGSGGTDSGNTITNSGIKCVLKGSPSYSIDTNGLMTINTTWILTPVVSSTTTDNILGWLAFEDQVRRWAGEVGDKYKQPKNSTSSRDITQYETSNAFRVSDISYAAAEGRTHYEVRYTNVQNVDDMVLTGNISANIDNNGEKTKTLVYVKDTGVNNAGFADVDALFIYTGATVNWAGADYLVTDTSYSAVDAHRYSITITVKDMSYMRIGNVVYATDGFGRKTATVTWRMSNRYYEEWTAPRIGSDASASLDLDANSGYIVTGVSANPIGSIGYNVEITAKYVGLRHITTSSELSAKTTSHVVTYESDERSLHTFNEIVGTDIAKLDNLITRGNRPYIVDGVIRNVSVSESSEGDYNVVVTADKGELVQTSISSARGSFTLTAHMCGWATGESGEPYAINFPPSTTFTLKLSVQELRDKGFTDAVLLEAIKGNGKIGFSYITGVQATGENGRLTNLTKEAMKSLTSLSSVASIYVSSYVYPQPSMPEYYVDNGDETQRPSTAPPMVTNTYFTQWSRENDLPMYFKADTDTGPKLSFNNSTEKYDVPLSRRYIGKKIPVIDITVTLPYYITPTQALTQTPSVYYEKAIKKVDNDRITSYKGMSVSMTTAKDSTGRDVVNVTCTLSALTGWYWNPMYERNDDDVFIHNKGS